MKNKIQVFNGIKFIDNESIIIDNKNEKFLQIILFALSKGC